MDQEKKIKTILMLVEIILILMIFRSYISYKFNLITIELFPNLDQMVI